MCYTQCMIDDSDWPEVYFGGRPPGSVEALGKRVDELERQLAQKDRTIVGMQNELRKAANFRHDDIAKQLEGVQIFLARAGEYQGRERKTRRNGR